MRRLFLSRPIIVTMIGLIVFLHSEIALAASKTSVLLDYIYLGKFSKEQANVALQKMPPLNKLTAHYSLTIYKLRYKTVDPFGKKTIASGLVTMPDSPTKAVAIVSYQHGTRVLRSDVPSNNETNYHIYSAVFGSSAGYMTVMPDYLGLGDNPLTPHPYMDSKTLASSCIDMLKAAKELAKKLNYPINEKLYLAGYSEGGFSTLVMFEALANSRKIPVSAVALGSAPYDLHETMTFILNQPGPRATIYMAYFFYAMQTYKTYWNGLDAIFSTPYDTLIPILFDGTHQTPEISQYLPPQPSEIFEKGFYEGIINETDNHFDAIKKEFNHYDFTPNAPLLLVGTKGDKDLPYHGAEIAYAVFKTKNQFVYIKSVSNVLDHVQALPYVLKEELDFFKRH